MRIRLTLQAGAYNVTILPYEKGTCCDLLTIKEENQNDKSFTSRVYQLPAEK